MGICLDTEQSDGSQTFEEGRDSWTRNSVRDSRTVATPPDGHFPMHNNGNVQFEAPKVPVIFVLGGPGSGKVTHCDNLMQEKKGITHINMTDLLQQYAIGNGTGLIDVFSRNEEMQDFSLLSSKTVTEVLMLEMKMAPNAKTYLVSGYPRNMRDVVEYSEKIQVVNGVLLISWRQKVLERQIDYGAKLGQVVLSLARMELNNFYKNVMPVADYFDQSNMLIAVNGERHPGDVYTDFKDAVMKILGNQDNPPVFSNGNVVTVDVDVASELPVVPPVPKPVPERLVEPSRPKTQVISVAAKQPVAVANSTQQQQQQPQPSQHNRHTWPPVLWVIGGPGSNKAALCSQASKETGWVHISLGRLLRASAEGTNIRQGSDAAKIRDSIAAGELVPLDIIMKIVESHMASNMTANGIILDGFPRDMTQTTEFENKFKQKPTIILLDCSKLQLGRGRLDDSVTAFRRRLEIFRESSLPMLKAMDNIGRLTIVDGDTDTAPVQEDFKSVVKDHIDYIKEHSIQLRTPPHGVLGNGALGNGGLPNGYSSGVPNGIATGMNGHLPNGHLQRQNTELEDLEQEPINTISKQVQNGVNHMSNGVNHMTNGVKNMANGFAKPAAAIGNGFAGNPKYASLDAERRENIRNMYHDVTVNTHI